MTVSDMMLRRGLPRVSGGEPWPGEAAVAPSEAARFRTRGAHPDGGPRNRVPRHAAEGSPLSPHGKAGASTGVALRRGLPRVAGGDPWPPAGLAPETHAPAPPAATKPAPPAATKPAPQAAAAEPRWSRKRVGAVVAAAAGLGVAAALAVLGSRALVQVPAVADFMTRYPGEVETEADPGIPAWVGWQHFLNAFFMVLIIRSGLHVRAERRPPAYWTSRRGGAKKVSLTVWLHQALDLLWLLNGIVFIVLLFASGHWLRIVPTTWEILPNALSAGLQYASLDWPTEHGWANYNSLQQLAYFATIFIAAPLAAVSGFRMSGWWPAGAEKLSRAYPIEWARTVHFPVMLYFVIFIVFHVLLVMTTGMLRNLNHMFAAQDAATWTGFWVFVGSLVVIAIGWFAARPVVAAPIAKLFGTVSSR